MRGTDTLENVVGKVHEISANHYDEIVPVHEMEFDNLTQMWIGGKSVELLPSAQRLFANRLRVPYSYLARCPSHLQAKNLNYWIEQERKNRDTFFCRFAGNRLRAVFTERYTVIDHMEILSQMVQHGFNPAAEVQYSLDDTMMVVKVPEYDRAFDVSFGVARIDEIIPGISFANSEVGILSVCIEAYFYRLICTNGLISKVSSASSRFKHISTRLLENFPETLTHVIEDSKRRQGQFMLSTKTTVDNPLDTISAFSKQFGLSLIETEVVRQSFYLESGATMFHIINAFTRAAQEPNLTVSDSYRLEKVGGQILALVK
jgi:hypothetical protein